jgi:hypothetical protein
MCITHRENVAILFARLLYTELHTDYRVCVLNPVPRGVAKHFDFLHAI